MAAERKRLKRKQFPDHGSKGIERETRVIRYFQERDEKQMKEQLDNIVERGYALNGVKIC